MSSETTEDSFPLLNLTELVSRAPLPSSGVATGEGPLTHQHDPCISVRRLHTDDAVVLDTLSPEDVQGWCLFRIGEYRARISTLRSCPDSLMYNASLYGSIVQLKSNMCALRTVYNDAAPIHRNLPPEILLEIFANFRHNGTRWGHAAWRVCHYWHDLLQRTPQFWKSLLDREFLGNWELQWKTARFGAAFFKSAPLDLSLRLRGIVPATVDIFAPHLRRISSMTIRVVGHPEEWEALDWFLRLDVTEMRIRELEVRLGHMGSFRTPPIHITPFSPLPHLDTLRLSYMPVQPMTVPLPLLRHLELKDCLDSSLLRYLDLRTILAIMRNSPNLETIFIVSSSRITLSDLEPLVDLPRLRHVNLQLSPESTCALLPYLVFPRTALLDLKPRMAYVPHTPLPLSSSLVASLGRPPTTEVAMDLQFTHRRTIATWEAQGGGSRPLRISHDSLSEHHPDSTLAYTAEVLAVYARGTTVTSLTVAGARRSALKSYWTAILTGLPHLTRLAVHGGDVRDSPMLLPLLAKGRGDRGCLCPRLADLSVFWDERYASPQAGATRARATADSPPPEGIDESGYPPLLLTVTDPPVDEAPFRQPYGLAATYACCRFLELCLRSRAEHGCCSLRTLSVSIWDYWRNWSHRNVSCEAASAVKAILREGLGDLVEEVFVNLQSEWEV